MCDVREVMFSGVDLWSMSYDSGRRMIVRSNPCGIAYRLLYSCHEVALYHNYEMTSWRKVSRKASRF